jgi:hypothetical protein
MRNYTIIINRVLLDWLVEKGWDVGNVYVGDNEACEDRYWKYFISFEKYEGDKLLNTVEVAFTQSELEAADKDMLSSGAPQFIRAKLGEELA